MQHAPRWLNTENDETAANRQTASLAALAVLLLLVVVCLGLINVLHREAKLEDCMLSGRQNCVEIATLR